MSGKASRKQKARGGDAQASRQVAREQKRAEFEQTERGSRWHLILAGLALVAIVAVAAVVLVTRDGGPSAEPAAPVASGGDEVAIALADLADGQAKFYSYDAGGVEVRYFVMRSGDGEYRAAFDACDVCYANKKGYTQQGDVLVCNNCGQQFDSAQINEVRGGCNPSPIERSVDGQNLVLKTSDLQAGVQYFQ